MAACCTAAIRLPLAGHVADASGGGDEATGCADPFGRPCLPDRPGCRCPAARCGSVVPLGASGCRCHRQFCRRPHGSSWTHGSGARRARCCPARARIRLQRLSRCGNRPERRRLRPAGRRARGHAHTTRRIRQWGQPGSARRGCADGSAHRRGQFLRAAGGAVRPGLQHQLPGGPDCLLQRRPGRPDQPHRRRLLRLTADLPLPVSRPAAWALRASTRSDLNVSPDRPAGDIGPASCSCIPARIPALADRLYTRAPGAFAQRARGRFPPLSALTTRPGPAAPLPTPRRRSTGPR